MVGQTSAKTLLSIARVDAASITASPAAVLAPALPAPGAAGLRAQRRQSQHAAIVPRNPKGG